MTSLSHDGSEVATPDEGQPPFPGIRTTTDGSGAVMWVEKQIAQGACAFPITPTTSMGSDFAAAAANGATNLWGETLQFLQPESEHSAASAAEGFALAGGRVANFTSGQGLVLMKEVLYTISGKRLPVVFQIGARALTSHSLNVHAGHDDVMAVADTGWCIVFAKNAQQASDLSLVARRAAENSHTPYMVCQDGFLTTHTLETVHLPEKEFMKEFVGDPNERVPNLFDPQRPVMSGTVQNQDSYMKGKIAQRFFTDRTARFTVEAMDTFAQATGRRLAPVLTHGMEDAEVAIVTMGSMVETAEATVDWLRANTEMRVGVIQIVTFRPFPSAELVEALSGVRAAAVIERMDNPLAHSNPVACEIKAALADALSGAPGLPSLSRIPEIQCGIAGLGSRDVRPGHFVAVAKNLYSHGARTFVLGIDHALSLPMSVDPDVRPAGAFSMRGYSVGGFGSVTTNKVIATIAGDLFGLNVQAYPYYGSEKKGLPTRYFLTAAPSHIRAHCELTLVDFVPLNSLNAFNLGDPLEGISEGGAVFVQSHETDPARVWDQVPAFAQRMIREQSLKLYYLNAAKIAAEVASRPDLEVRMQGILLLGVFLRVTPFAAERGLSHDELMESVEGSLRRFFGKAGEQVVQDNLTCVRKGHDEVLEVPTEVMGIAQSASALAGSERSVQDLMTHGAITCLPQTPLPEVRELLVEKGISCVVVVDGDGAMQGLLSTTDLARSQDIARSLDSSLPQLLPEHLMTREVLTTTPEEDLSDAAERMIKARVHRLVVTAPDSPEHPIGILSLTDLASSGTESGSTPA